MQHMYDNLEQYSPEGVTLRQTNESALITDRTAKILVGANTPDLQAVYYC